MDLGDDFVSKSRTRPQSLKHIVEIVEKRNELSLSESSTNARKRKRWRLLEEKKEMWKTKGRDINIEMLREALSESKGALSHTHLAPEKHESHSFSSVISEVVPKVSACSHSSIKFTS